MRGFPVTHVVTIETYDFKMCPPCRERYRIYGNTKRAKWKYERDAFQSEMKALRAAEDEKRKAQGLGVCRTVSYFSASNQPW